MMSYFNYCNCGLEGCPYSWALGNTVPPYGQPISAAGYRGGAPQHQIWNNYGYGMVPGAAGSAAGAVYEAAGFPMTQGCGPGTDAPWYTQMGQHGTPRAMSPNSDAAFGGMPQQFPGGGVPPPPWALRGPPRSSRPDRRGPNSRQVRTAKAGAGSGESPSSREEATPPPPPPPSGIAPRMGNITPPLALPPPPGISPGGSGNFPGSPFGHPHSDAMTTTIPPDMMPSPPAAAAGGKKRGPGRPRAGSSAMANEMAAAVAAGGMGPMGPMGMMDPACAGAPGLVGAAAAAVMGPDGKGSKGGSAAANKKRYVCEICQKRFSTAWYVRVHRKSHNGERPYICHNCGKGFMLPNVLQVHLRKCEKTAPVAGASAAGAGGPSIGGSEHGHGPLPEQMQPHPATSSSADNSSSSSSLSRPLVPAHPMPPVPAGFPSSDHIGPMPFGRGSPMGPLTGAGGPGDLIHFNQRFMHGGYPPPPLPSASAQPIGDQQQPMGVPPSIMHHGTYDMQQQQQQAVSPHSLCDPPGQFPPGMYSPGQMGHHQPSQNHHQQEHRQQQQQHHQEQEQQQQRTPPSTSTGSASECPPSGPRSLPSPGHFLGNDRPRDKGGGAVGGGGGGGGESVSGGSDNGSTKGASPDLYCSMCEIQFEEKMPLEEHLKSHRPYSCEVCDKRFSQKCNLITHMRLHTGEKPYTCNFCEKRFTQKGNLDAHLKTHTKEKPYPCPHPRCDKKFSFKSSMLSHVKQNHGGHPPPQPQASHLHGGALERNPFEYDEDDITSIKQQIKFTSASTTDFPVSPNNFSSGIPTPQSSLDSMPGGCTQQHPGAGAPLGYQYAPSQASVATASGGGAILPPGGPYVPHPDAPSTPHSRSTPETPLALSGGSGCGDGTDLSTPHPAAATEQSNISKLAQAVQSVTAAAAVSSKITASETEGDGGDRDGSSGGTVGRQTLAIS